VRVETCRGLTERAWPPRDIRDKQARRVRRAERVWVSSMTGRCLDDEGAKNECREEHERCAPASRRETCHCECSDSESLGPEREMERGKKQVLITSPLVRFPFRPARLPTPTLSSARSSSTTSPPHASMPSATFVSPRGQLTAVPSRRTSPFSLHGPRRVPAPVVDVHAHTPAAAPAAEDTNEFH
jgi:hypothetical protein